MTDPLKCQWPVKRDGMWTWCAKPAYQGWSYCEEHAALHLSNELKAENDAAPQQPGKDSTEKRSDTDS